VVSGENNSDIYFYIALLLFKSERFNNPISSLFIFVININPAFFADIFPFNH
jgi:hypothetical protein